MPEKTHVPDSQTTPYCHGIVEDWNSILNPESAETYLAGLRTSNPGEQVKLTNCNT